MGTILGLTLGLSVGALVVDIVLGTGTPDKAPLEEVAVGAALGLQTEYNWAAWSVQYGTPQSLGTQCAPDDSSWVLTLGLSVGALVVDIVLGTGTPDKAPQSLGTKFNPDDSSWLRCSD